MIKDTKMTQNTRVGNIYFLLMLLPFFISPSLGLILAVIFYACSSRKQDLLIYLALILAGWISLINITKIPVSDQAKYQETFRQATDMPFFYWWEMASRGTFKEPVFYIFTYLSNVIFGGNEKCYFFFLSFINYFILYSVSIRFSKAINSNIYYALASIIVITFFSQYFTLTLHIIRQILAATIVIYAIVMKAIDGKNRYLTLFCALLVHTSVVFLVVLSLIPWFYKRLTMMQVGICVAVLVLFIILFGSIGAYLLSTAGSSGGDYLFSRMQDEATDGVGQMSMTTVLTVLGPLIIVSIKLLFYDLPHKHYYSIIHKDHSAFYPIIYIFLILSLFIIGMTKAPLIQYRFFMMSYVFIPFILPYLIYKQNPLYKYYLTFVSVFFIVRFMLTHNHSDFTYWSLLEIFTLPLPMYF